MPYEEKNLINCSQFEELLTEYLDKTLESSSHKSVATHALSCPLCHSLLNEVKASLAVCREIADPKMPAMRGISPSATKSASPARKVAA